jgi:hypothetical protein
VARKITLIIDGTPVHITQAGQEALWKAHAQIFPDYGRTASIAIETVTAQALARSQLITFREKWATINVTLTARGRQALAQMAERKANAAGAEWPGEPPKAAPTPRTRKAGAGGPGSQHTA